MSSIYLGKRLADHQWEPFRPARKPTEESHGAKYKLCEGPFETAKAALEKLEYYRGLR